METLTENVFDVEDNLGAKLSMRIVLINLFRSLIYHDQGKIREGLIRAMSAYRNTVRLLFSLGIANPNDAFHTGQLVDVTGDCNTFVMEDMRVDTGSDKDYNDIIFQVRGATGSAISLDDAIASGKDGRNSDLDQALITYDNCEFTDNQPFLDVIDTGFAANNFVRISAEAIAANNLAASNYVVRFSDVLNKPANRIYGLYGLYGNVYAVVYGNEGNDTLESGDDDDYLEGEAGFDKLYGQQGNDLLCNDGNDYLECEIRRDKLLGGQQNHYHDCGADKDIVDGGAGDDILPIFWAGGRFCCLTCLHCFKSTIDSTSNHVPGSYIKDSIRNLLNKQKMSIFPAPVAGKSMYLAKFSEQEHHYKRQFLPLAPIISNNRFSPALVSTCLLTVTLQQTCAACLFTEIYIIKGFQIRVAPVSIVATTESYKTQHQLASDKDAIASLIHLLTINTSLLEEVTRGMSFVAIMTKLSISALGAFKVCSDSPDRAPPLIYKS